MSGTESITSSQLCEEEQQLLHKLAREAVAYGVTHHRHMPVDIKRYPPVLREPGASFVTLLKAGELRGCIGTLEAYQSLVQDVARNAYAAAFSDPRFPPVAIHELPDLEIHISILTPSIPMTFTSEEDLVRQIQPGIDGLIIEEGSRRATFLPSVWETLPDVRQFLQHLKLKAGLPADYWSSTIRVSRYTTESF